MGNQESSAPQSTSFHIAHARDGRNESVAWIVTRFTPLLRAQADYRLRGSLRRQWEADDLVGEVWLSVLPRMQDLRPRDGRWTPVLLKFLATTLLHKVNQLLTRQARAARGKAVDGEGVPVESLPAEITEVVSQAMRNEANRILELELERLSPAEREILVLRGIEQLPYAEIANYLEATVGAVTMRYHRTIEKLRRQLSGSILNEIDDD